MFINSSSNSGGGLGDADELYAMAQSQGGAIAEAANEIYHPNTGILSTIGNGFKNAFKDFVDIISIPSEIVAGAISDQYTIGEAIDKNIMPSQVLMGDQDPDATILQKTGSFFTRFALDVLLDPTTYLTFGTGTLLKTSAKTALGVKITAQIDEELTKQIFKATGKTTVEDLQKEFIKKRTAELAIENNTTLEALTKEYVLNKEGDQFAKKYAQQLKDGRVEDFIKNEGVKLVNASADANGVATKTIKDAMDEVRASIDGIKTGGISAETKNLLKSTIDAPLDLKHAAEVMGTMLSKKPSLIEQFTDKGGIKYFGKTILESQRLSKAIHAIPMVNQLEHASQGLRDMVYGGRETAAINKGIGSQAREFDKLAGQFADIAKRQKVDAMQHLTEIIRQNKLTYAETELVTAAIEVGKLPIDPKHRSIYLASIGLTDEFLQDPRIVNAIRSVNGINARNYKEAIAKGIPVSRKDFYMFHLTDTEVVQKSFQGMSPNVKLANAKEAKIEKFTSDELKVTKIGKAEQFGLEKYYPEIEMKAYKDSLQNLEESYKIKIDDVKTQVESLQSKINETFSKFATEDFAKIINESVPEGRADNLQSAIAVFKEKLPVVNFAALKKSNELIEKNTNEALSNLPMSDKVQAQINKLTEQIKDLPETIGETVNKVNAAVANRNNKLMSMTDESIDKAIAASDEVISPETKIVLKQLKDIKKTKAQEIMRNGINEDEMGKYINSLADEFNSNPVGVRHLVDALVGKENKLVGLIDDVSRRKYAIMQQMDKTGQLAFQDVKMYRSKQGEIYRATRPTIAESEGAGIHFEKSILPIMVHASNNTIKATVSKDFITEVASKFGLPLSQAPEGYREVSVSALKETPFNLSNFLTGKNGEPIVFHPLIAKRIENFNRSVINDDDINSILEKFDKLTNLFKASVTSIFPQFHGRNAISNVLNSMLDIGRGAVNPANHAMAAHLATHAYSISSLKKEIIKGTPGAEEKLARVLATDMFTDNNNYTWSVGQIYQIMRNKNIAFGNQFAGHAEITSGTLKDQIKSIKSEMKGDESAFERNKLMAKAILTPDVNNNFIFKSGQKIGQTVEDHSRIIHFIEHLKRTGDVEMASDRTKMFLFDYGAISPFEREFMKRIIPFYTWTKKNIELQTKVLLTTPGRTAAQVKLYNSLGDAMSGSTELTDEEYRNLPGYMQSMFQATIKRDGGKVYTLSNFGSPIEAALSILRPSNLLASTNPFLRLPIELSTGYDTFRAGMMTDTNNAKLIKDAPQAVKDLVGFVHYQYKDKETGKWVDKYTATNPKAFFFIMNQPIGSRIFKEYLTLGSKEFDEMSTKQQLLRELAGIQINEIDPVKNIQYKNKEKVKQLQQLLEDSGLIYKLDKPIQSKNTRIIEN